MSEFIKIANNGQWTLNKSLHDEKGRCTSCGNKACDGADCKTDHAKVAVEANEKKNKEFANKIKLSNQQSQK